MRMPPLLQYLENYQADEIIYPAKVAEQFDIDIVSAYRYLDSGVRENLITSVLEPYCKECGKFSGRHYDTLWDIPEHLICPHCGKEMDALVNSIVVYRKVLT